MVCITQTAPVKVNGQVWMVINTVDTGTRRGSIHWLRIDAANTAIIDEGYIGDATQSFLFPSIAANHDGDVVIGFNGVGPAQVSLQAACGDRQDHRRENGLRRPDASQAWARQLSAPNRCGNASWGDFSRTTLSPENDKTFWTIQQIAVDKTHLATEITALHSEH